MRAPHYADASVRIFHGDCLDVLRELPDASVDSVVTDPPYGLEFMGKEWDSFRPEDYRGGRWDGQGLKVTTGDTAEQGAEEMADRLKALPSLTYKANQKCRNCGKWQRDKPHRKCVCAAPDFEPRTNDRNHGFQQWCELWAAECLRVLKPGGHLLAFGGSRTWHRLASAVEDAGFEIRDSIAWLYGSGFPKSLDVSKAIDKQRDDKADVHRVTSHLADLAGAAGITRADIDEHMGTSDMGGWWLSRLPHRSACPSVENWTLLRDFIPGAHVLDAEVWRLNGRKGSPGEAWEQREILSERTRKATGRMAQGEGGYAFGEQFSETAPATPDAERWQGWGTALKPAFEPVVVARKPLAGTVAANVTTHGTGALNIDGCRIGREDGDRTEYGRGRHLPHANTTASLGKFAEVTPYNPHDAGRWPANVVLDESQAAELDQQSGEAGGGTGRSTRGGGSGGDWNPTDRTERAGQAVRGDGREVGYGDTGGASRFFYVAKADASERPRVDGVAHPTVKPLALIRWLVRLVTPPGGTVLELFAGSGTTVEACIVEGFQCIAIEREADYLPLIEARIARRRDPVRAIELAKEDAGLFALLDEEPA